ncbi:squalene-hopene cyclase-like protein [Streptomyces sp. TLI_55]|uniref:prenyltransferase/squalene oxidase repeat-containing protein n=1 Tax=Streptomyces sp. TLI_55 TaxID=1938861 RepID=UPI000BCFE11B|nr:prenyltransferase/squalene oxidase repeat-containing protein [Streptomyces sp. TLI_55]SNX58105.1 squalene-hopene cyclase-like protein [Streptomyces sp. TLI_55]
MNVRRSAAVLAATAVIGTATPAVAADPSASPSPSPSVAIPEGLYGVGDPTYDGVWRQSWALIAQNKQSVVPARKAVDWLAGQQCANGAFPAFRADPSKPCDAEVMVDTNSTAAAVHALAVVGSTHEDAVRKGVAWLRSVQNKDGGWGYTPGGATDANSTSVVIDALLSSNEVDSTSEFKKAGHTPSDALLKLALPCTGDGAGAFAYQPDKKGKLTANADATAAAVLSGMGGGPETILLGDDQSSASCEKPSSFETAVHNGASYLAKTMSKDKYLKSVLPGSEDQPDYGNTADAVVALSAAEFNDEAAASAHWLETHALKWAAQSGPAAYAQLIFAARSAGVDPRDFGGKNLVTLLNATGPKPEHLPTAEEAPHLEGKSGKDDDGTLTVAWAVGGGLLLGALIGFGLMLRGRKRGQ